MFSNQKDTLRERLCTPEKDLHSQIKKGFIELEETIKKGFCNISEGG